MKKQKASKTPQRSVYRSNTPSHLSTHLGNRQQALSTYRAISRTKTKDEAILEEAALLREAKGLNQWIEEEDPDSVQILEKIGQICPKYERILKLFTAEYQNYVKNKYHVYPKPNDTSHTQESDQNTQSMLKAERDSLRQQLEALQRKESSLIAVISQLHESILSFLITESADTESDVDQTSKEPETLEDNLKEKEKLENQLKTMHERLEDLNLLIRAFKY